MLKYFSTNTDAEAAPETKSSIEGPPTAAIYLLYWYKSTNTEREAAPETKRSIEGPPTAAAYEVAYGV